MMHASLFDFGAKAKVVITYNFNSNCAKRRRTQHDNCTTCTTQFGAYTFIDLLHVIVHYSKWFPKCHSMGAYKFKISIWLNLKARKKNPKTMKQKTTIKKF
jgi:hypothetical protein